MKWLIGTMLLIASTAHGYQHDGASFVEDTVYVHNGTSFVEGSKFMHDGASFVEIEVLGGAYDATYDFEGSDAIGSGTLANWANFGSGPDPGYSTSGLSLELLDCLHYAAAEGATLTFTNSSDASKYAAFKIQLDENIEIHENGVFTVRNGSNVVVGSFGFRADNTFSHQASGGTLRFGGAWTAGTSLFVKIMFTQGTGSNATTRMWYSADGASWTEVDSASSDGTSTTTPAKVRIINTADTENIYLDYLIEDGEDITDASF